MHDSLIIRAGLFLCTYRYSVQALQFQEQEFSNQLIIQEIPDTLKEVWRCATYYHN